MSEPRPQHWADAVAQELLHTHTRHLISTGITPSGEYHVGHLREVLTAEGIYRALRDHGAECRLHYIADTPSTRSTWGNPCAISPARVGRTPAMRSIFWRPFWRPCRRSA